MSNTPTESEFDKELDRIFGEVYDNEMNLDSARDELKEAFDKQVDQLQTYKFTTSGEDKMVMLDDVKALYRGDKK